MPAPSPGLHHVTAMCSDPQANLDFYTGTLGLRLVKVAVNFDSPDMYHLYYGDAAGRPGTVVTFFAMPSARPIPPGHGTGSALALAVPEASLTRWQRRLESLGIPVAGPYERLGEAYLALSDPDGLRIELVGNNSLPADTVWTAGPVPADMAVRGLHGFTALPARLAATGRFLEAVLGFGTSLWGPGDGRQRYGSAGPVGTPGAYVDLPSDPAPDKPHLGAGGIHHVAFRAHDDAHQHALREAMLSHSLRPTQVIDRYYFHSVYVREPGGLLCEVATDAPGFTRDEPREKLGSGLCLPPQFAGDRAAIAAALPRLRLPATGESLP